MQNYLVLSKVITISSKANIRPFYLPLRNPKVLQLYFVEAKTKLKVISEVFKSYRHSIKIYLDKPCHYTLYPLSGTGRRYRTMEIGRSFWTTAVERMQSKIFTIVQRNSRQVRTINIKYFRLDESERLLQINQKFPDP